MKKEITAGSHDKLIDLFMVPKWSTLTITVAIIFTAIFIITGFVRYAHENFRVELQLLKMEQQANRLNALEWQAISKKELDSEIIAEVNEARVLMKNTLDYLAEHDPEGEEMDGVQQAYNNYISALEEEFDLVARGEIPEAFALDHQKVDPAYEKLEEAMKEVSVIHSAAARKAGTAAIVGAVSTVIGATILMVILFWQYDRARLTAHLAIFERNAAYEGMERYERLVELHPDAVIIEVDGECVFVNSAGVEVFTAGDPMEIYGKSLVEVVCPQNRDSFLRLTREALKTGEIKVADDIILGSVGQPRPARITILSFSFHDKPALQAVIHLKQVQ